MTARFYPALITPEEHAIIQRSLVPDGGCDDSFVINENLKGLAEFERAMKEACDRLFGPDPVDPGENGQ